MIQDNTWRHTTKAGLGPGFSLADSERNDLLISRHRWIKAWIITMGLFLGLLALTFVLWPRAVRADEVSWIASWYSEQSLKDEGTWHTSKGIMANGQRFDETAMTCASHDWPLGTWLIVTNERTGRSVRVKVTDRIGKRFAGIRVDLSRAAFQQIAELRIGVVRVKVREA